jgi:hypothetical protein
MRISSSTLLPLHHTLKVFDIEYLLDRKVEYNSQRERNYRIWGLKGFIAVFAWTARRALRLERWDCGKDLGARFITPY